MIGSPLGRIDPADPLASQAYKASSKDPTKAVEQVAKVGEAAEDTILPEKAPAKVVTVVPEGHLVDVGS